MPIIGVQLDQTGDWADSVCNNAHVACNFATRGRKSDLFRRKLHICVTEESGNGL